MLHLKDQADVASTTAYTRVYVDFEYWVTSKFLARISSGNKASEIKAKEILVKDE